MASLSLISPFEVWKEAKELSVSFQRWFLPIMELLYRKEVFACSTDYQNTTKKWPVPCLFHILLQITRTCRLVSSFPQFPRLRFPSPGGGWCLLSGQPSSHSHACVLAPTPGLWIRSQATAVVGGILRWKKSFLPENNVTVESFLNGRPLNVLWLRNWKNLWVITLNFKGLGSSVQSIK